MLGMDWIGSCTYPMEEILERVTNATCDVVTPSGQACSLPLQPGLYGLNHTIETHLPAIPSALRPFLEGTLEVQVVLATPDNEEVACLLFC